MSYRDERAAPVASSRSRFLREAAKFAAVGGAGVAVNLLVFNLLHHLTPLPVVDASVLATVVAIAFNYVGFRYFAYRERDKSRATREVTLFLGFSALGLVIENGILYVAVHGFGLDGAWQANVAKFTGIAVATLFRFWSYRTWVFRVLPAGPPSPVALRGTEIAARHHPLAPHHGPPVRTHPRGRPVGATALRSARWHPQPHDGHR